MDKPKPGMSITSSRAAITPEVKTQLEDLVERIKGEVKYQSFRDSSGRSGNRITIQYNIQD